MSERATNAPMAIHEVMKTCFRKLSEIGDIATEKVDDPTYHGDMEVLLLSKVGDKRGYLVYTIGE